MTTPVWIWAAIAALTLAACKDERPAAKGAGASGAGAVTGDRGLALPIRDVAGPAVVPVVTGSITFVVPKAAVTWAELSFPCYAAGATMSSGAAGRPGAAFEQVSPLIAVAMAAAQIDLDTDVAAIGGFGCGGGPCIYLAANLRAPDKIKDALAVIPGATPTDHGGGHYSVTLAGASGQRTIHVRVVPVKWTGGAAPVDPWTTWQAKATHVVFLSGLIGGGADVDPMTLIHGPADALAKVAATETVIADARGRCVIGTAAPTDSELVPGFKLDRGRFVMAAPAGRGDPLTRLLDSERTLDVEVELTLTPAPTPADLTRWIGAGRAWLAELAVPVRAQFAAQGPMVDRLIEMFALLGERGFAPVMKGKQVTLSWRTDRVPQAALDELERSFESAR